MAIVGANHMLKVYMADDADYLHITEDATKMTLSVKNTTTGLVAADKPVVIPTFESNDATCNNLDVVGVFTSNNLDVSGALTCNDLTIGTNTLTVDTNTNYVGIGKIPETKFDVDGSIAASGGITAGGGVFCYSMNASFRTTTGELLCDSISTTGIVSTGALTCDSLTTTGNVSTGALTCDSLTTTGLVDTCGGGFQFPCGASTADRPTGLGAGDIGRCIFLTNNDTLHIWNGAAWRSRQFNA